MSAVSSPSHTGENEDPSGVSKRVESWLSGQRSEEAISEAELASR